MLLIKKYAVDQNSAVDLHHWLRPYEAFAYKNIGDLKMLKEQNNFSKNIIVKSDSPYSQQLIDKMVLLIKEELHHFCQVLEIMDKKGIVYQSIPASRYAKGMFSHVKTYEPDTLIDKLIIGAYIEARSCERFARLAPYMDNDIAGFYFSLLRSEARHFQDYLNLAQSISSKDILPRIQEFGRIEAELISSPDKDFKFHSGIPAQ
ncbi:tRNA-(MS[2]IO[6]A)-hydroxylase (MiaE) [Vibrio aerogenes CECT 7868]|uniref:tRNA-(MS[2]IO[6]A)-hydroxylase (MiaE) n=2 Tax=Vibrio aerogenes TaxID=92172 RepID=A0A1M5X557_9VIBR|nr:tRNA-(MS[2]IO[6]A)-hydroxylase (MiaE) [Vibrio aerogenes CECT 7868]